MRIALLLLLLAGGALGHDGGSVGVVPAEKTTAGLLREVEYAFAFSVQNTHAAPMVAALEVQGPAAPWVRVAPLLLPVPAQQAAAFEAVVRVPADAPNGEHPVLLVATFTPGPGPAASGFSVAPAVGARLVLHVTGEEMRRLVFASVHAADVEEGTPATALLRLRNEGNVREDPAGHLTVRRLADGAVVHQAALSGDLALPPLQESERAVPLPVLPLGQYVLEATVEGQVREAAFKVVPSGTLGKDAVLRALEHPTHATVGAPVRIEALFANVGSVAVARAVLLLDVDGPVAERRESEPMRLAAGEEGRAAVGWTPMEPGRYTLRGVLAYDGWRSPASESHLEVAGAASSPPWIAVAGVAVILLMTAAYAAGRRRG